MTPEAHQEHDDKLTSPTAPRFYQTGYCQTEGEQTTSPVPAVPSTDRSPWLQYGVAVLAVIVATAIRLQLDPLWGDNYPFITFFITMVFVAWYTGFRPSLLVLALSTLLARYLFTSPRYSLLGISLDDVVGLGFFVGISLIIALVMESQRRAQGRAEASALNAIQKQQAIERAKDDLKHSEERSRSVMDHVIDAIITIDERGRIESHNLAAQKLFGYSAAELIGSNVNMLMPEPYHGEHDSYLANYLRTGQAKIMGIGTEVVGRRKDGSTFPLALGISEFRIGQQRFFTGICRDITERKRAKQLLIEHSAEVEAANKELEAFSYSVAHDLRAPLRHIHGYIEMLAKDAEGQLSAKSQRFLKVISESSGQMGALIDDLLAFSRMGRVEMHETHVRLDDLVQACLRTLELATGGRNIVWKIPPLPAVLGDHALLQQVFANLLGNAVKYTSARDPAEIEIGCAGEEDGRLILFVRDNGVGFDMKYVHKLFGVFQRLHSADEFEGTGIGLANVRRIIARHGGRTWAESVLNEGAAFYFTVKPASAA